MDTPIAPDQKITPESIKEQLREHQAELRYKYPSIDLSEASYHTEHADFPGSRHSSLNTEPLTLDAEQIHAAKDEVVDILQKTDADAAFGIFTKDTQPGVEEALSQESEAEDLAKQINVLVEKAQQVVEANNELHSKISEAPSFSAESSQALDTVTDIPTTAAQLDVKTKSD